MLTCLKKLNSYESTIKYLKLIFIKNFIGKGTKYQVLNCGSQSYLF